MTKFLTPRTLDFSIEVNSIYVEGGDVFSGRQQIFIGDHSVCLAGRSRPH